MMQPLPSLLFEWIDELIDAEAATPISIACTIRLTRAKFSGLPVSNDELAGFIAARAAHDGRGIEFDACELPLQ